MAGGGKKKKRRQGGGAGGQGKRSRGGARPKREAEAADPEDGPDLQFEDPYGDDFAEEQEVVDGGAGGGGDDEMKGAGSSSAGGGGATVQRVWRPGTTELGADEALEWDPSAYTAYHKLRLDWPCLSFDVIRDHLGDFRSRFPVTAYIAVGTQADRAENNVVRVMKVSDLHRTRRDGADEDGDDDDDDGGDDEEAADDESDAGDLDDDPVLEERTFPHPGGVNRLRSMPQNPYLLATMADTGRVHVWNVLDELKGLDAPRGRAPPDAREPVFTFEGHATEGFAVDWSLQQPGRLVTGDCDRYVHVWEPAEATWTVDRVPFAGHTASVEDLQWSPSQPDVFASCSVDRTVRVWDTRTKERSQLFVAAHKQDVNVISWNRRTSYLLCSGSDDGSFKIWDLRRFRSDSHAAHFKWHRGPITSVEWHPTEESALAVSSADHSTTVWDLALEGDDGPARGAALGDVELPPQLLFEHLGQRDVKEVHWHPQVSNLLISTAADGLDIFRPSNLSEPPRPAGAAV